MASAPRIHIYRTYRFLDKDPVIYSLKTIADDERLKIGTAASLSGLAAATIDNWFNGGTRKPQHSSICAFTSALGYVRRDELGKDGGLVIRYVKAAAYDWKAEAEKAADWLLKQDRKKARKKKAKANGGG